MSNTNEGQETVNQPVESTQPAEETLQNINHTVTQVDVDLNPNEGLVVGEEIVIPGDAVVEAELEEPTSEFIDLRPKAVPVADVELSEEFLSILDEYHKSLPEGYTVSVMADGFPVLEIISFDKSIPNTAYHIQNLRAILVRNENTYGNHKRFVGTQEELVKLFNPNGQSAPL
jgi:hypothetical protein